MLDRTRVSTAFAAIRALTDEEYAFVTQFVRAQATNPQPIKTNGTLAGRAPKGSALASERAKKAWKTRKKNEKKRAAKQGEDGSGTAPGSATDDSA